MPLSPALQALEVTKGIGISFLGGPVCKDGETFPPSVSLLSPPVTLYCSLDLKMFPSCAEEVHTHTSLPHLSAFLYPECCYSAF